LSPDGGHSTEIILIVDAGAEFSIHCFVRPVHPGRKLQFMGMEFGLWWSGSGARLRWHLLPSTLASVAEQFVQGLSHIYRSRMTLHTQSFQPSQVGWILAIARHSVVSFTRAKVHRGFIITFYSFASASIRFFTLAWSQVLYKCLTVMLT